MADRLSLEKLEKLKKQALGAVARAHARKALDELRVRYLGRKSEINTLLRGLAELSLEEKREIGARANEIKQELEAEFAAWESAALKRELEQGDKPDLTLPGTPAHFGRRHPLNIVAGRILKVFEGMGFKYVEGSEIESDENNFTMLNMPEDHPAREMQDTFYLQNVEGRGEDAGKLLLRTHTTPVWIPVMKNAPPPYRVVSCGKVFRRDAIDATHLPFFHQIDAFAVDENCSMADLKSTLEIWARELFGPQTQIRFRPSYFPFTEPSCEVEVRCFLCQGKTCSTCKNGWIEMLGAGMIHPAILERLGHDPKKWRGFAFGLGLERVAMVAWGIPDIRLFYENDLRFLEQFSL
ncbi:MAG: phenylalanine--tRNA ligase subunit alpha [Elusimicrobia bacterium]|nr:phenylalanine--tRNA ligase subunit alpha [Elusimicrobiota bacterium]